MIVTCPLSFCTLGDGPAVYHVGATSWSGSERARVPAIQSAVSDVLRADLDGGRESDVVAGRGEAE